MAINPMKRKTRMAFIIGFLIAFLISAIIIFMLYNQKNESDKKLKSYTSTLQSVYVLNQSVKSGQVLTVSMFKQVQIPVTAVPANIALDIASLIAKMSISDTEGHSIYTENNSEGQITSYFVMINGEKKTIYMNDSEGKPVIATALNMEDKAFYYQGSNNTNPKTITIMSSDNVVVSKVALGANTVVTPSMLTRTDEKITADVRKEEYNVIDLPIDLFTGDYIDVRLMLPNGQNYIVVSKKQVTIPMTSTGYSADTIQINLSEEEILKMSAAIVENYKIKGSKLYATRYAEAGMQSPSIATYVPNTDVLELIQNDQNIVSKAIGSLRKRNNAIDSAINKYGDDEAVGDNMAEDSATSREARKEYLESLGGGVPVQ